MKTAISKRTCQSPVEFRVKVCGKPATWKHVARNSFEGYNWIATSYWCEECAKEAKKFFEFLGPSKTEFDPKWIKLRRSRKIVE